MLVLVPTEALLSKSFRTGRGPLLSVHELEELNTRCGVQVRRRKSWIEKDGRYWSIRIEGGFVIDG